VLDRVTELDGEAMSGAEAVCGVGVGAAGIVNAAGRVLSATDTFANWVGTDLVAGLRTRLASDLPVVVRNDVEAHLLGESWLGAASGWSSVLLVAVGTGVGGALLLDGRLWRGAHYAAGELGHVPTPGAEGLRCPCGRLGHLEALAAGPAIAAAYRRASDQEVDAREVFARAEAGDRAALAVVRAAADALGRVIAGLVTAFDPGCVVIGGGVSAAGSLWWDPLVAASRAELVAPFHDVPIVPARLGPAAAILGAGRSVFTLIDDRCVAVQTE